MGFSVIRITERYTKTDMTYVFRGGAWLTFGQIISTGLSLLLMIVFANALNKETFGMYKYILALASLLSITTLPGMGTAITRSVARGFYGSLLPATKTCIRWGISGSIIAGGIALYYYLNGNIPLSFSILIIAVFVPIFDPFGNFSSYFLGKPDFRGTSITNTIIQVFSTIALIGGVFLSGNIFVLLIIYFSVYTVLRFFCFRYTLAQFPLDAPVDSETIPYGKHLSLMGVLGAIASSIDKVVLFHFLGATDVALYSVAIAPGDQLKSIVGLMDTLLFPKFAHNTEAMSRTHMLRTSLLFLISSSVLVGMYILIAPFLFPLFFPAYTHVVWLSILYVLSLLNSGFGPAAIFLGATGKIREQYWFNTLSSIVQIISVIVGGAYAGILGVIVARIFSRFAGGIICLYFYYIPLSSSKSTS